MHQFCSLNGHTKLAEKEHYEQNRILSILRYTLNSWEFSLSISMETIMKNMVSVEVLRPYYFYATWCVPAVLERSPSRSPQFLQPLQQCTHNRERKSSRKNITLPCRFKNKWKCKLQLPTPRSSTQLQLSVIMQSIIRFQNFSQHRNDDLVENAVLSDKGTVTNVLGMQPHWGRDICPWPPSPIS